MSIAERNGQRIVVQTETGGAPGDVVLLLSDPKGRLRPLSNESGCRRAGKLLMWQGDGGKPLVFELQRDCRQTEDSTCTGSLTQ